MIEQVIIISLAITLVYVSMWDGMIWGGFRMKVLDPYTPQFLRKPLFDCIICMASIWGTLIYFGYFHRFTFDFTWDNYLMTILCVGGLNTLIAGVIALAHDCEDEKNYVKKQDKEVVNDEKDSLVFAGVHTCTVKGKVKVLSSEDKESLKRMVSETLKMIDEQ